MRGAPHDWYGSANLIGYELLFGGHEALALAFSFAPFVYFVVKHFSHIGGSSSSTTAHCISPVASIVRRTTSASATMLAPMSA